MPKETVALQSLMARVIAGVEQTHMTLSALLRSLGFSVDTAGTWKNVLAAQSSDDLMASSLLHGTDTDYTV